MISTVTISTITTVTTIAAMGLTVTLGAAIVVALLLFLTSKELASASLSPSPKLIAKFLNVGIVPMIMVFAAIVAIRIAEVLA